MHFLAQVICVCCAHQVATTSATASTTFMDAAIVSAGQGFVHCSISDSHACSRDAVTECVPSFNFAPQNTFTIGDAARAANLNFSSHFGGKW